MTPDNAEPILQDLESFVSKAVNVDDQIAENVGVISNILTAIADLARSGRLTISKKVR